MPDPAGSAEDREKKSASLFFLVGRWKPSDPAEAPPDFVNLATGRVQPTSSLVMEQVFGPKLKKDWGENGCRGQGSPRPRAVILVLDWRAAGTRETLIHCRGQGSPRPRAVVLVLETIYPFVGRLLCGRGRFAPGPLPHEPEED